MSTSILITPAPDTCRFKVGDWVSHNGGLITLDSKRQIRETMGYCQHGGYQYRLLREDESGAGFAYDCELDKWPGDDKDYPLISDRV